MRHLLKLPRMLPFPRWRRWHREVALCTQGHTAIKCPDRDWNSDSLALLFSCHHPVSFHVTEVRTRGRATQLQGQWEFRGEAPRSASPHPRDTSQILKYWSLPHLPHPINHESHQPNLLGLSLGPQFRPKPSSCLPQWAETASYLTPYAGTKDLPCATI